MWSRLLALALLLLPTPALADVKEKVAALAPSGVVLVVDREGSELVAQNADEPFVPSTMGQSSRPRHGRDRGCDGGQRLLCGDSGSLGVTVERVHSKSGSA
jgi:hypothetical protein